MIKIAVTGPESSGKTSLAIELSKLFDAALVEEYARIYLSEKGAAYTWADLDIIAGKQFDSAINALEESKRFVIADTDMHTMAIWSIDKYGAVSPKIAGLLMKEDFDLYLLCRPDIPWQQDPLRENPNDRDRLFGLYLDSLKNAQRRFEIIEGSGNSRLEVALWALQKHFGNLAIQY